MAITVGARWGEGTLQAAHRIPVRWETWGSVNTLNSAARPPFFLSRLELAGTRLVGMTATRPDQPAPSLGRSYRPPRVSGSPRIEGAPNRVGLVIYSAKSASAFMDLVTAPMVHGSPRSEQRGVCLPKRKQSEGRLKKRRQGGLRCSCGCLQLLPQSPRPETISPTASRASRPAIRCPRRSTRVAR